MSISLKTKLAASYTGLAVLVLTTTGVGIVTQQRTQADFDHVANTLNERVALTNDVIDAVNARAVAARNLVLVTSAEDRAAEKAAVTASHEKVQKSLNNLRSAVAKSADDNETTAAVAAMGQLEGKYGPVALAIVEAAVNGDKNRAIEQMNRDCRPLLAALLAESDKLLAHTKAKTHQSLESAKQHASTAMAMLVGVLGLALLIAGGLGFFIPRSVMRQLGADPADLATAAERISAGDLGPVAGAESAPAGSVLASMSAMRNNLATIVNQVRDGSDGVATASAQIAQGNQDLSSRTEQQASALQQTAASMEELGTTVSQNADSARQADQLAKSASAVAVQGGEVVKQVVDTMNGIDASSRKIADIIGVIDGIAFQTNILALNAAVEAARAGEQGRGFAVVAGEVRTLAQRSAEAAKEIKSLIGASVEQVERGNTLVTQAGATMAEIVSSVQRVTDIMGEISSASEQQRSGVQQVGEAVTQMDQATQQNAALVEESAAAAESMRQQALQLVQAVSVFKLAGGRHPAIAAHTATSGHSAPARAVAPKPAQVRKPVASQSAHIAPRAEPAKPESQGVPAGGEDWAAF